MTEITQADKDAAARLNGYARWEIWLIVPLHDKEWMQLCAADFARHRIAERAKIVAWLRKEAPAALHDPRMVANAIEAGEHETFTHPDNV